MNETETARYMDFLSIASEQLESGGHDVAREFIDDARVGLVNANEEELADQLQDAVDAIDRGEYDEAKARNRDVYTELLP